MRQTITPALITPQDAMGEPVVLGLYHVNINVADLERSRVFYEMLGFSVLETFEQMGESELDQGLGLPYTHCKALFMGIGRNRFETVLDLCEWQDPKTGGGPPVVTNIGMPRMALRVKNLDAMVAKLERLGVTFISGPKRLNFLARKPRFCCCQDPDGIYVELVEL